MTNGLSDAEWARHFAEYQRHAPDVVTRHDGLSDELIALLEAGAITVEQALLDWYPDVVGRWDDTPTGEMAVVG